VQLQTANWLYYLQKAKGHVGIVGPMFKMVEISSMTEAKCYTFVASNFQELAVNLNAQGADHP